MLTLSRECVIICWILQFSFHAKYGSRLFKYVFTYTHCSILFHCHTPWLLFEQHFRNNMPLHIHLLHYTNQFVSQRTPIYRVASVVLLDGTARRRRASRRHVPVAHVLILPSACIPTPHHSWWKAKKEGTVVV
jgi:hypothetical protein